MPKNSNGNYQYENIRGSWQKFFPCTGLMEVCKQIIENFENKLPNNNKTRSLQKALQKGHLPIQQLLLQVLNNTQELWKISDFEAIEDLESQMTRFYAMYPSRKGQNPLHFAAMTGKIQIFMKMSEDSEDEKNLNPKHED